MPKAIDLTGKVFGRLTAIKSTSERKYGKVVWICLCECGKEHRVAVNNLQHGSVKSCGCLNNEVRANRLRENGFVQSAICPYSPRKLVEIYKNGDSLESIAKECGFSDGIVVRRWLEAEGVHIRSRHEAHQVRASRYRISLRVQLAKAQCKRTHLVKNGEMRIDWLNTPQSIRKRVRSYLKTIAARRVKQQAEREQAEAIERALNGETFR